MRKYIETMYNKVHYDCSNIAVTIQESRYYGFRGVVWKYEKVGDDNDGLSYHYNLYHYDTLILTIGTCGGIIQTVTNGFGYSATDRIAIQSLLQKWGITTINARVRDDAIQLYMIKDGIEYIARCKEGFYIHQGDLKFHAY